MRDPKRTSRMTTLTADELVAEGHRLHKLGNFVVFLPPAQEWMAVQTQMPFLRSEKIPVAPQSRAAGQPPQHP
jgi:hypothetical protein